jgi:hypothetical protein
MRFTSVAAIAALAGCSAASVPGTHTQSDRDTNVYSRHAVALYMKAHGLRSSLQIPSGVLYSGPKIVEHNGQDSGSANKTASAGGVCPQSTKRTSTYTNPCGGGEVNVNDFTSLSDTPYGDPIDVVVQWGNASVEIYQPDNGSDSDVTLTDPSLSAPVYDTASTRSTQGIGGTIRDGVIGWLVGHALDWVFGHDLNGNPSGGVIVYGVPATPAPNGGQWIPIPIILRPGQPLPPGWVPAPPPTSQPPNIGPGLPPGCSSAWVGADCKNLS